MALYRCGNSAIKIDDFNYYPERASSFYASDLILNIIPIKLTKLVVNINQYNPADYATNWTPDVRIRRKGTNIWDSLDVVTTITINRNSTEYYSRTFTTFGNYTYDAIKWHQNDPIRSQESSANPKPHFTVSGTLSK